MTPGLHVQERGRERHPLRHRGAGAVPGDYYYYHHYHLNEANIVIIISSSRSSIIIIIIITIIIISSRGRQGHEGRGGRAPAARGRHVADRGEIDI